MQYLNEQLPLPYLKIDRDGKILSYSGQALEYFDLSQEHLMHLVDEESIFKILENGFQGNSSKRTEINMKTLRDPLVLFDVYILWNSSDHGNLLFLPKEVDNGAIIEKMLALQQRLSSTDFELFEKKEELEQVLIRLNELSGPFIPLSDKMCMVPIFGDITSEKIHVISEKCLQEVFAGEFDEVLVDLTAVGEISARGIEAFTKLLKTLHFMTGSYIKLIGIRPELVKKLNPYGLDEYALFDTSLRDALKKHFV